MPAQKMQEILLKDLKMMKNLRNKTQPFNVVGTGKGCVFASISSECTKKQMSLKKNDKNNGKKGKNLTETEENGENSTKYVGDIRDI